MTDPLSWIREKDCYITPGYIIEQVARVSTAGVIGLDPCAGKNTQHATVNWCLPETGIDGLSNPWIGHGLVFCNPPYSPGNLARWSKKCALESDLGAEVIGLMPASTGAKWMFEWVYPYASAISWLSGRVVFIDPYTLEKSRQSGFMWSALIYWGDHPKRFAKRVSLGQLTLLS